MHLKRKTKTKTFVEALPHAGVQDLLLSLLFPHWLATTVRNAHSPFAAFNTDECRCDTHRQTACKVGQSTVD